MTYQLDPSYPIEPGVYKFRPNADTAWCIVKLTPDEYGNLMLPNEFQIYGLKPGFEFISLEKAKSMSLNKSDYPTCKTCKAWEVFAKYVQWDKDEHGRCFVISEKLHFDLPTATPENFGCIHHEPKPSDPYIYLQVGDYTQEGDEMQYPQSKDWTPLHNVGQKITEFNLQIRRKI